MSAGGGCPFSSRRGFMAAAGGLAGAAGIGLATAGTVRQGAQGAAPAGPAPAIEPFWGSHQGGIITPRQSSTYFAAFDLTTTKRADVAALLRRWTEAAARMSTGKAAAGDSGETAGLSPSRLTLTFGFGAGLFGHDRFGLGRHRPAALLDMPAFNGDQLQPGRTGGDLSVQACADDPQVSFHAVRELSRLAYGIAQLRWVQSGFCADFPAAETPRNLMGFKDGTLNPGPALPGGPDDTHEVVWVGDEGPAWMRGGSYVVARRIRVALEHWDRMETDFQERVFGRRKLSGAPLGRQREMDALDLEADDKDGNPFIPDDAHARLAAASSNGGARILRRGYAYNDGVSMTAERWPPWHRGIEFDAGLLFIAYQRDPRRGFIKIFDKMSKLDALNQFTTHTGGGLFACPAGTRQGGFIGQGLFEA